MNQEQKGKKWDRGHDVQGGSPEEFAKLIRFDVEKYSRVIREARIKIG